MAFVTRFAPSPTGPLHLGHAYSAMLAHDMARAEGGRFLLRIEDTDLERSKPAFEAAIRDDVAWLGLTWDGALRRQSDHIDHYSGFLVPLATQGLLYPCRCTRSDLRAAASAPQERVTFNVYPGTCRDRSMVSRRPDDALRLNLAKALDRLANPLPAFVETGPGHTGRHVIDRDAALRRIGDVVLSRKGANIVAYFLASAIDDAVQGVTHVVRGEDLFEFTAVQVILQHLLGLPTPTYHHHRLIRDDQGRRLAKRDDARALSKYRAEGATPADIRRMVGL
ncbi:MAG: tRNA glutamyl-Q(34) synthetase GluQRS [Gemmobacter sp.]